MKKLISICNKIYSKLTGKDVQKIQSDIIDSLERELDEQRQHNYLLSQEIDSLQDTLEVSRRTVNNRDKDNAILQNRINDLTAIRRGLDGDIRELQNKPVRIEQQFVMTQRVYDDLERALEVPIVTNNTSAQGAGYLVGMQRVLSEIRKRYVTNN